MPFQLVKLLDPLNPTIITGGLVPRGAYNAGTDYAVGDSVDYNGSSYVMYVDAGAGTLPTDTTKWQVVANKGDTGATGSTGSTGATGPAGLSGGITRSVVVTSGNVTAGATALTDYVYAISGAHTVTLPTCVGNTNRYSLKNSHSVNVSLAFTSSQTADGGGITLAPSESVDLISNNTEWKII